jgi:hypothetical protein
LLAAVFVSAAEAAADGSQRVEQDDDSTARSIIPAAPDAAAAIDKHQVSVAITIGVDRS